MLYQFAFTKTIRHIQAAVLVGVCSLGSVAFACGFDGPIHHGDGSGVSGGVRVSTSWNGERAQFPRSGYYFLDLGPDACDRKIELFVWEYAARAGTDSTYSFGDDADSLGQYAWF